MSTKKQRGEAPVCPIPLNCVSGDKIKLSDGSVWERTTDPIWHSGDASRASMEFTKDGIYRQWLPTGRHLHGCEFPCVQFIRAATPKPAKAKSEVRVWKRWAVVVKDGIFMDGSMTRQEARNLCEDGDRVIRVEVREIK